MPEITSESKELYRSISEQRREYIRRVIDQDNDVFDLLGATAEELTYLVERNENDLSNASLKSKSVLEKYGVALTGIMLAANLDVARLIGTNATETIDSRYHDGKLTSIAQEREDFIVNDIDDNFLKRRIFEDGLSVQGRIKNISESFVKTIRDIIAVGIAEKKSAQQISQDIDNMIIPNPNETWTGPFDFYRERFGYKIKRVPIGRQAGSVAFNSLRIARTEVNLTYRNATVKYHKGQEWVKGFEWKLSAAHPKTDVCDDYEGQVFQDVPFTHPNCFCYVIPLLKTRKEI